MATGERICVSCGSAQQTAEVCGVCHAPLILAGHYEAFRTTSDALAEKAFEVSDDRTGTRYVLAPIAVDPVRPAFAAKLERRLRTWRPADSEGAVSLIKLVRVSNGTDSLKLFVVRERARGQSLGGGARLANEDALAMARSVLRAVSSVQSHTPTFRHGAIVAANIASNAHGFALGPPSFDPAFLEETPDAARADVEQLATLVRELVTDEKGEIAESWKRWLARSTGRGESPYRNAKAALAGLDTVRDKAASDPSWRGTRDGVVSEPSSKAAAPTPPVTSASSSTPSPGGVPNAKRKTKRERRALAAAAEASGTAGTNTATKSQASGAKETANRAWTAGVFLVLGVACLAFEVIAMGK